MIAPVKANGDSYIFDKASRLMDANVTDLAFEEGNRLTVIPHRRKTCD
jgi:hypothetical protein